VRIERIRLRAELEAPTLVAGARRHRARGNPLERVRVARLQHHGLAVNRIDRGRYQIVTATYEARAGPWRWTGPPGLRC
jgi:hypothetical protein